MPGEPQDDCLFCKIVAGHIPATIVRETDTTVAFRDINPQAPTHVLVVPKKAVRNVAELADADEALAGHLLLVCRWLVKELKLDGGYRIVANVGPDGGQSVDHLHLHILGGRQLGWPPG